MIKWKDLVNPAMNYEPRGFNPSLPLACQVTLAQPFLPSYVPTHKMSTVTQQHNW